MYKIDNLAITAEQLATIAEIDEFKGAWQFLGNLAPEQLQTLKKIATIESIGSSTRIEGSKLTDREVEALLTGLKTHSFSSRDEQEVGGYDLVCQEVFAGYESMPLSENIIKQLHALLLRYSTKDERRRGEYKKFPNNVEAIEENGRSLGIIFETTSPFETPMKMQELVQWTREQLELKTLHPLLVIGIFVVVFLAIHPFQDGNGRLSRVLTTMLLLKTGYTYAPYSSLESVIETNEALSGLKAGVSRGIRRSLLLRHFTRLPDVVLCTMPGAAFTVPCVVSTKHGSGPSGSANFLLRSSSFEERSRRPCPP